MSLIQQEVHLAPYTSWQVGGIAEHFALPENLEQLKAAVSWAKSKAQPLTLLGSGSNVLISDQGIGGLVICFRKLTGIQVTKEKGYLEMTALAGTTKAELLKTFLKFKLAPALFLAGIPGDVGGGVVMNAGVAENFTPREFCEIVDWVEVLKPEDESLKILSGADIQWSYRHSSGWQPGLITRVGLRWENAPDPDLLDKVKDANRMRLSKQPLDMPSCGSVFVNPPNGKAAQLIDSCGLKGFSIGGAQVSTKHANFIVNTGAATAAEIWAVIEHVQAVVKKQTGILLKTEVIRLGRWSS